MWRVAGVELLSDNSGCFMLVGAIQRPLVDDITVTGSGGDYYFLRVAVQFSSLLLLSFDDDTAGFRCILCRFMNCWGLVIALDRIFSRAMLQHNGCSVLRLCNASMHQFVVTCVAAPFSVTVSPLVTVHRYYRIRGGVGGKVNNLS